MATHEDVEIRLLGPVSADQGGSELPLGSGRRSAVLSVLALRVNQAVSREELIAALWGDKPPASASGNVYTYVSTLRKALEPTRRRWTSGQCLTSGVGHYCLRLPSNAIDVHRFEALRARARRYRADGDHLAELSALAAALRLWQGEALHGVPGPYAQRQRQRLTELHIATMQRHAELLVELGRHDEAIAELRAQVAAYPMHENLSTLLATALRASGRRAEAFVVLDRLRAVPQQRTSTRPSPAHHTTCRRIGSGGGPAPAPSGPTAPVIVGRAAELRLLRTAVAAVRAGHGGGVWLRGGPGMGKSTLLDAALRDAVVPGCRIGWAAGDELVRRIPLGVLRECLESAFPGRDRRLIEEFLPVAGATPAGASTDMASRAVATIRRVAAEGPLILVLDNLEQADDATLRVWAELHRYTGDPPLLLVGAGRLAATDHRLDALRAVQPHEIQLGGLAEADAVTLVRMVATEPPEPRALRQILADAGGNPHYLRRLAASSQPASPAAGRLPEQVVAAVDEHLEPLPEQTRQALRVVAFLSAGHATAGACSRCTIHEIVTVTGRSGEDLLRALAPAKDAGVLADTGPWVAFRHPIVGRVLDEGTPAALRIVLHRSFAEKLATAGGAPERVAAQLLAGPVPLAGWPSRWIEEHVEELGMRAPLLAIAVLRRARVQLHLDHGTRIALTAWLARLLFRNNRHAVAEAGWVAARTGDATLEAEMRWIVAATHVRREEYAEAAEVVRSVLAAGRAPKRWLTRFRRLHDELQPRLPADPVASIWNRRALFGTTVLSPMDGPAPAAGFARIA